MESKLFEDKSPEERKRILRDTADKIEETTFQKPLTDDELAERRERLVENSISLGVMEDQLSDIKADFKTKMDPIKKDTKQLLVDLKYKQKKVDGCLYHIADHEDGMMGTYDENGDLISERRLRPDERQLRIDHLSKAQ